MTIKPPRLVIEMRPGTKTWVVHGIGNFKTDAKSLREVAEVLEANYHGIDATVEFRANRQLIELSDEHLRELASYARDLGKTTSVQEALRASIAAGLVAIKASQQMEREIAHALASVRRKRETQDA